jgi:hypothetical protein
MIEPKFARRVPAPRGMGLIETPEWARTIKPEDQDWLNEIYNRQDIPAEFDATKKGLYIKLKQLW